MLGKVKHLHVGCDYGTDNLAKRPLPFHSSPRWVSVVHDANGLVRKGHGAGRLV
jgi:hypothetical protein